MLVDSSVLCFATYLAGRKLLLDVAYESYIVAFKHNSPNLLPDSFFNVNLFCLVQYCVHIFIEALTKEECCNSSYNNFSLDSHVLVVKEPDLNP